MEFTREEVKSMRDHLVSAIMYYEKKIEANTKELRNNPNDKDFAELVDFWTKEKANADELMDKLCNIK